MLVQPIHTLQSHLLHHADASHFVVAIAEPALQIVPFQPKPISRKLSHKALIFRWFYNDVTNLMVDFLPVKLSTMSICSLIRCFATSRVGT